jgi:hypothetical protein
MDASDDSKKSFIKHVFNFDDDSKSEILNITQYAIIAIIPVIILNKTIGKYVPEADDKKSSLEISAEVLIQMLVTFMGLFLVHRGITYVPTYSGVKYPEFNIIYNILIFLMITLSLQTKIGEKVSILVDRVYELWEGKPNKKNSKNGKQPNVKVSQPISGQVLNQNMNQSAMNQAMYSDGTSISSLPSGGDTQQTPNYDNMYRQDTTPLVNAATPGLAEGFVNEPMAANSVLGGGFGSSW